MLQLLATYLAQTHPVEYAAGLGVSALACAPGWWPWAIDQIKKIIGGAV